MLLMKAWAFLESHPTDATLKLPDVNKIAQEEWGRLQSQCGLNNVTLDVKYDSYYFSNRRGVLASASRTMFLIENKWQSGALNKYNAHGTIVIKINPFVPNGWYVDDGTCNTGYRYDLRSVIRHEIVHGVGVSSSIRDHDVGYAYGDHCYITSYDEHLKNKNNNTFLNGCALTETRSTDVYIAGVEIYNPSTFKVGSSFSHTHDSGVMYFSIAPMECMDYDTNVFKILNELGANCTDAGNRHVGWVSPVGNTTSQHGMVTSGASTLKIYLDVYILTLVLIKCLMTRLVV